MGKGSGYLLYQVLDRLVNYCFPILNKVIDNLERVEEEIFRKPLPETVHEISLLRRDIISFRRIVHPQIGVIESLEREEYPFLKEEQEVYFGDIADHIRKIWDGLEDCKEVVEGLTDTSNWLTSHRIQEVMRVLTIVMAIMAPLTVITGFYGMNIALPGGVDQGSFFSFTVLLIILLGIAGGMLYFFRRRRWI
jgi:magnesium transporter